MDTCINPDLHGGKKKLFTSLSSSLLLSPLFKAPLLLLFLLPRLIENKEWLIYLNPVWQLARQRASRHFSPKRSSFRLLSKSETWQAMDESWAWACNSTKYKQPLTRQDERRKTGMLNQITYSHSRIGWVRLAVDSLDGHAFLKCMKLIL